MKIDSAIIIAEMAIRQGISDPDLFNNLGYYYLTAKNYTAAIGRFQDCLKTENSSLPADASLGIAMAYFYQADLLNAKKYLKQARQSEPLLNQGMEGLPAMEEKGYSFSETKKETLKRMFDELK
jgi:tetratricopeptide (TPR) repeat protein